MLATRLINVGEIRTVEVPTPTPGAGDIVIQVEAAGICGTDRHLSKVNFPQFRARPLGMNFLE